MYAQIRTAFLLLLLSLSATSSWSQNVTGVVKDENGDLLPNAQVRILELPQKRVLTDFDGAFSFELPYNQKLTLQITYTLYDTIKEDVFINEGKVLNKQYAMKVFVAKESSLEEIEVSARRLRTNDNYMDGLKRKSAVTMDYVSNESMKKTGDANVVAAVARVSGVSTNGGLITVRGIGDRYVKTTLNGLRIPTLDPLTNNIKLDLFPASLIDNVILSKTASPDLPGDFAGAYLSVETKDYSDKLTVSIESQFNFNPQTSFKKVISSERSKTDWLGYDKDLRSHSTAPLKAPNLTPTSYDEFSALGLGNYYKKMGVTGWVDGTPESETYVRLGLVELGLLGKTQMNDASAVQQAKATYNQNYKQKAFDEINSNGTDYSNGFGNNWNTVYRTGPIGFTQNISVANQTKLFGKTLGYVAGFRYGNSFRYDSKGNSQRIGAEELNYPIDVQDETQISRETNGWNALLNFSYALNKNNKVVAMFMPNVSATNDVASYTSVDENIATQEGRTQLTQFFEQRQQRVAQLKTEHFFPGSKAKLEVQVGYTKGNSEAPDFKVTQYGFIKENNQIIDYIFAPSAGDGIRRYYRYLSDNILDSKMNLELPFGEKAGESEEKKRVRKIKVGTAYQYNNRVADQYEYFLKDGNNDQKAQLESDDLNGYLSPNKFIITDGKVDFYYDERFDDRNHTIGESKIAAGYLLMDYEWDNGWRTAGGFRVEHISLFSDVRAYHELNYAVNDQRRENLGGFPLVNPGKIQETNFLPSFNIVKQTNKFFIGKTAFFRFNASETVARPSMRELNDAAIYDNEYRTLIYGNSELKTAHVKNVDMRFEAYFKNNDNISMSLFYKDFKNHIEMGFGSSGVTWENIPQSRVAGIELEAKKTIAKVLEIKANVTLVDSKAQFIRRDLVIDKGIKVYTPIDTVNRPMFGQAPYLVNAIASYSNDSLGMTITASYNIQGPRLVISGVVKGRPDVYELQRNVVDFKYTQRISKHFSASLTLRDLLNAPVRRAYKIGKEWKDYDAFRYGTSFILGVSYRL